MDPIARILRDHGLLILDGALATELERRGADLHDPLWSAKTLIEAPELIKSVHADYFAAGADCATTATYQATYQGFARRGLDADESLEVMHLAVRLAVEARDAFWADPANRAGRPRPLVAASIGSYGAFLADGSEYRGDYDLDEAALMAFHRPRMAALARSDADLFACETIPCLVEAVALARLLAEFPGCHAWISFSAGDASHTCRGEPLAGCAAQLDRYDQVAAIGVNCTAPCYISDLVDGVRAGTGKPVIVYPNSGETYRPDSGNWTGAAESGSYADLASEWYVRGAHVIGGCCRTTPAHIRAVSHRLRG